MKEAIEEASALGLEVIGALLGNDSEERTRFEGKALSPAILASARCLVFFTQWRGGVVVGGSHGSGFAIARTASDGWSAPCFVQINRLELGAVFGVEKANIVMAAMTSRGLAELTAGKHQTFGTDVTIQLWPFSPAGSGPDDTISMDIGSDWVAASVAQGLIFDFSLGGGSLSVDESKNKKVYGEGITPGDILGGKIEQKSEMVPLYQRIRAIASTVAY